MGNIMISLDLDKEFKDSRYKIVVNEYDIVEKTKHLNVLEKLMLTEIDPTLTAVPECKCRTTRGGWKLGSICNTCGSEVQRADNSDLSPTTWFKSKVKGVKFINPAIYAFVDTKVMGNKRKEGVEKENDDTPCSGKKFSVLNYLSSASARKNSAMSTVDQLIIDRITSLKGYERNFRYFSRNFIKISRVIAEIKGGNAGREIIEFLDSLDSNKVHTSYIPIINGKLVYKTGASGNNKITPTFNAIRNLLLGYVDNPKDENAMLNQMASVNYKSSCIYTVHVKDLISGKPGVGRKMGMSSKLDFSSRNVCIPSNLITDIREVHMPYRNSIVMFRLHIANVLLRKMSLRRTHKKIRDAKVKFDQEIYDIMTSIINNSNTRLDDGRGYQGIIVGRNPGLLSGSILRLRLSMIKSDINDDTMEVSTALAKLPNWDYDGDLLYTFLPLSQYVYDLFEPLDPYTSVNDPKSPGGVYGKIWIGPTAPLNIANKLRVVRRKYES